MSAEAAAAAVTIPQYASQLADARDPLQGVLGDAWAVEPLPTTSNPLATSAMPFPTSAMPFPTSATPLPTTTTPFSAPPAAFGAVAAPGSWSSAPPPARFAAEPSNGTAIAGFVLGLLGFSLIGLFVSIAGLRKAREFSASGMRPAGRVLARWGVAFSVIGLTFSIAVGALYAVAGPTIISYLPV